MRWVREPLSCSCGFRRGRNGKCRAAGVRLRDLNRRTIWLLRPSALYTLSTISAFNFPPSVFCKHQRAVDAVDVMVGGADPAFGEEFAHGFEQDLVGEGRSGPVALAGCRYAHLRGGSSGLVGVSLGNWGFKFEDPVAATR